MKARCYAKVFAVLLAGCLFAGRAGAQGFGLSVSNSPNPATTTTPLNYTILLTNLTGLTFGDVLITNAFPPSVVILSASSSQGLVTTNSSNVVFELGAFGTGFFAQMNITVQPTAPGLITNLITIDPLITSNTVVQDVVLVISGNSDLGVSIAPPATGILVGDHINYAVTVTNSGPNAAPNVILSNTLPPGMLFLGVSPTNQAFTLTSNSVSFNLGTLNAGTNTTLNLTLQPTNASNFVLTAFVGALGLIDTNSANDTATTVIPVVSPQLGTLVASNLSAMTYNPQTGLMQQTVQISNIGTNDVSAARLIVAGLTNRLYNAVGTNSGNPFVIYNSTIAVGQNVSLLLEYFIPTRLPINVPNSNYTVVGIPAVSLTPPAGTPFNITLFTNLPSGSVLIEFQSVPGHTYTILYADNPAFTNALTAQPSIVAPADRTQWIDSGPPKTISAPTNSVSRFYKILQSH